MARNKETPSPCCAAPPVLSARALIDPDRAAQLEGLFGILANDTRLRMLHALVRAGELNVTDLGATVGLSSQAVSNQLQRLVDRGILKPRREGNCVFYRIVNTCVTDLLDRALCLVEASCPDD